MRSHRYGVATAVVALLLGAPAITVAQTAGNAASFAIVGGQAVSANGTGSTVNGNVGVNPAAATAITGFTPPTATIVPPFANQGNSAAAIAASASVTTLYNSAELAPAGGTPTPANLTLGGPTNNGLYTPGKYFVNVGTALIPGGQTITLLTPGLYIFTVNSDLTAGVGSSIILGPGVDPCNVWWRVPTQATLNGSSFVGTVVSNAAIVLGVGASLNGRALTTAAGAVTLSGTNQIGSPCAAAAPLPGCPTLTISPAALPNASLGVFYSQQLSASGGTGLYTFTVPAGTLPPGLTLSSSGLLSGTPTVVNPQTFTITVRDSASCAGSRTFTMTVVEGTPPPPGCPVITLDPTTLPNGVVGVEYSQQITALGALTAVTFTRTAGDLLPAGLTLSPSGLISGTPTSPLSMTFTIRGTDANGCFAERSFQIVMLAGVPALPQAFVIVMLLGLLFIGYLQLRRRARVEPR